MCVQRYGCVCVWRRWNGHSIIVVGTATTLKTPTPTISVQWDTALLRRKSELPTAAKIFRFYCQMSVGFPITLWLWTQYLLDTVWIIRPNDWKYQTFFIVQITIRMGFAGQIPHSVKKMSKTSNKGIFMHGQTGRMQRLLPITGISSL